jgi:hypothetical protein
VNSISPKISILKNIEMNIIPEEDEKDKSIYNITRKNFAKQISSPKKSNETNFMEKMDKQSTKQEDLQKDNKNNNYHLFVRKYIY